MFFLRWNVQLGLDRLNGDDWLTLIETTNLASNLYKRNLESKDYIYIHLYSIAFFSRYLFE